MNNRKLYRKVEGDHTAIMSVVLINMVILLGIGIILARLI